MAEEIILMRRDAQAATMINVRELSSTFHDLSSMEEIQFIQFIRSFIVDMKNSSMLQAALLMTTRRLHGNIQASRIAGSPT